MQLQKYLRHWNVIWFKWPVHDLVLVTPLHPISKLLAIQDHAKKMDEQLWMGGRREVSIVSQRPVTSSDLEQERSLFFECLNIFQTGCSRNLFRLPWEWSTWFQLLLFSGIFFCLNNPFFFFICLSNLTEINKS